MSSFTNTVCISAMGLVTPLGESFDDVSAALYEGRTGLRPIEKYATATYETKWAGVPVFGNEALRWPRRSGDHRIEPGEPRYARRAAEHLAASVDVTALYPEARLGCVLGVDEPEIDPEQCMELAAALGVEGTRDRGTLLAAASERFRVAQLLDLDVTSALRAVHGVIPFGGYARAHVGLCSASLQALGMARAAILEGRIDAAIVGGVSAKVTPANIARLEAIGAVCTDRLLEGAARSRPFDARRSGFVPAEGAVLFLVEREDVVRRRGARALLRVLGYGSSLAAEHVVQPHRTSLEMRLAMERAIANAGASRASFSSVNAHGTSTKLNDLHESRALRAVFGDAVPPVTATKGHHGHLIAAAGAMELVGVMASFAHDFLPAIRNLEDVGDGIDVPLVRERDDRRVDLVLKNAFGMGGLASSAVVQNPSASNG